MQSNGSDVVPGALREGVDKWMSIVRAPLSGGDRLKLSFICWRGLGKLG
jgi:hypothetical protein